ncbi:exonuclease SbcC [Pseudonocardia sediminis]|uniref:Nuclease SbcCD subunit C n=1 Tax=Pseudonocardia sediminis TaxID=1397368 RepID=A0A4Q7UZZ2_PSEST|nr:SMC family ATPase [Pseudonocardia sediminis]RZT86708.1 exonuclease SbcC [Pseudonocardia sediminis]
MRPVLLRMDGFASFREPTVVDFRGADYFVLVGPTGSGKSTVIDAMTFALYGSVPRWDDRRTVGLALAPTAGRGTVSLVFDLAGTRYVVARELRRTASTGNVTVKGARLERLVNPESDGGPESATEPVADGAATVSKQVEALLGLPFEDFCTCVVLPQGDFADFLHAAPNDRQKKLERILGLDVYEQIMRRANEDSKIAGQRADLLGEQLERYADATDDAEQAATVRVTALEDLASRVEKALPELSAADTDLAAAETTVTRLRGERDLLAALQVPDGLAALGLRRHSSARAAATAREQADAAERDDLAAREARDAAAPERGRLERVRRDHAELAVFDAKLPALVTRHDEAGTGAARAATDAEAARTAVDTARTARDAAGDALTTAQETLRRLTTEIRALRTPSAPGGLDELDRRRTAATVGLDEATRAVTAAEEAETAARDAAAAAPDRAPLEQARRDHHELAAARTERDAADARLTAAEREAAVAGGALADARDHLDAARAEQSGIERTNQAAVLRPALAVGEDCPVCAQTVATLPPPLPGADLDGARHAVDAADEVYERARSAKTAADTARATAVAEVERATAAVARLEAALAGLPDPDGVEETLAGIDRLARDVDDAATAARTARRERDAAAGVVESVRTDTAAAAAQLGTARDPLVPFGAPGVDTDDVAAGWRALVAWAKSEAARREKEAGPAQAATEAAERDRAAAEQAFADADHAATARRRDETAAARAEQEAAGALATAQRRAGELRTSLDGEPTDTQAAAELARIDALDASAREADVALRAARTALRTAEEDARAGEREVQQAWDALRATRDPLVALGAPALDGDEPAAAGKALTTWATRETTARERSLADAHDATDHARTHRDSLQERLVEDLRTHDVSAGPEPARTAPAAVATALESARAARARVVERREAAAGLVADRAQAQESREVAKLLGDQLRSNNFPRWLVASALDALVVDASASLADLSGGQFELTHDKGEFLVVDHADADARRPVKTLSGGETFQASLALALALSAQLSGLAAHGAPTLESIFLDEGFGTLDEANLEIVASALENLAVRGDRMVGVITHVPALAERIPVRFSLSRDQRTSSVVREGA